MAARSTAAEPVLDLFAPSHVVIVAADIDAAMRESAMHGKHPGSQVGTEASDRTSVIRLLRTRSAPKA